LRRLEPLWPELEAWGGPRQQDLWRLHLNELRAQWKSSEDHERARDYIYALRRANHYSQIVADFLPLFADPDPEKDYDTLWIAAPLASSLAQLGRWDEADALLTRLLLVWPVGKDANALNLIANRGRLRYERGKQAEAIADLSVAIADGERREGEVSASALASMHLALACSLHELRRDAEAIPSSAYVLGNGFWVTRAKLHLCFGRQEAARDALLAGLENESEREQVVDFMQIENEPPAPSELERRLAERRRALLQDPQLLAAVARHGRILTYPLRAGAPLEAPVPAR
jgi:tetratricopeptide (TPR) repeat protein